MEAEEWPSGCCVEGLLSGNRFFTRAFRTHRIVARFPQSVRDRTEVAIEPTR